MTRKIIQISDQELAKQANYTEKLKKYTDSILNQIGRPLRYFIRTFGCQQNEADSESLAGILEAAGFEPTTDYSSADLSLINTCSIRENADDRLYGHLGILKTLKDEKPDRLTVVCGCMLTQKQHIEKIKKSYSFVDLLFGPQDIFRFPQLLYQAISSGKMQVALSEDDPVVEGIPVQRSRKHRALVSIMYGCDHYCTYCIVPYTRGRERSRLASDILQELTDLAAEGYREVMLLGQNVNCWGKDFRRRKIRDEKAPEIQDFADLLAAAAQVPGLEMIRYMSPYPRDFTDKLIEVIGRYPAIEPHIHLPLQSGSNAVLRRMRRGYDRDKFLDIVRAARKARPGISITTDIIVGFPGETDRDFEDTLELMEEVQFDSAFTFIYSARQGTPAAEYKDTVPKDVINERFDRLLNLQNRHSLAANKRLEGSSVRVMVEGTSGGDPNKLTGRTADFKLVNFSLTPDQVTALGPGAVGEHGLAGAYFEGKYAQVKLTKAKTFSLEGELEDLEQS